MQLYAQLQRGADFAKLAKQYSDDTGSAPQGGKLGPYSPGRLPREIDAQVSRLQPGQVSSPVLSQYGIHIFKAGAKQATPLAQIKPQLITEIQRENAFKKVEELRKTAKVDFDPKFFPGANKKPAALPPSATASPSMPPSAPPSATEPR